MYRENLKWQSIADVWPVTAKWSEANGQQIEQPADVSEISARGAVLEMEACPAPGTELTIIDRRSNRVGTARTVRGRKEGPIFWVVVALLRWNEDSAIELYPSGSTVVQPRQPRPRRYPFFANAELTDLTSANELKAVTSDLSLFGCRITTDAHWPVGKKIRIRITRSGTNFAALGRIVYVRSPQGIGIAFTRIDGREQAILDKWIAELRASESGN